MLVSGKMAITPLWNELGEEVIPFLKTTGSELSDEHKNFMIPSKNDECLKLATLPPKKGKKLNENALF